MTHEPDPQGHTDRNYPQDPLTQWRLALARRNRYEGIVRSALLDYEKGDWEVLKRLVKNYQIARSEAHQAAINLRSSSKKEN